MADNLLTYEELRLALASADVISSDSFGIARRLLQFAASNDYNQVSQDLLLRALHHRAAFGNSAVLLSGLAREFGLFPYLQVDDLSLRDRIAYECHRPEGMEDVVFHREQARVYTALSTGRSVILSAPTSFGKSLIIDALVAGGQYRNLAIIVPTIALIDETRRRLSVYGDRYKLLTHVTQGRSERNIFIFTQERILEMEDIGIVDLFVVDEFYKLDPGEGQTDERCSILNRVFYAIHKSRKQYYLLGPGIGDIDVPVKSRLRAAFVYEEYTTVAHDEFRIPAGEDKLTALIDLCRGLDDPTIIFCSSPQRAAEVALALADSGIVSASDTAFEAGAWAAEHIHPGWHFARALSCGIGIHHGRIPRALGQFVVRAFNSDALRFLVCTSTLIEGVNTKAKNVIIYDMSINRRRLNLFTFNNIRGRSGRMFQHFIGRVYYFDDPPASGLPTVDIPGLSQSDKASLALLLQIDNDDLTEISRDRVNVLDQPAVLSFEVLRTNAGVDPALQLALAQDLQENVETMRALLAWSYEPSWEQRLAICDLIWRHFDGARLGRRSVLSPGELAMLLKRLGERPTLSTRALIDREILYRRDRGQAIPDDEVATRLLDFRRVWANLHFPRLLRALSNIQREVLSRVGYEYGNYEWYAARVECYFRGPALVALDEYGLPLELAERLPLGLDESSGIDVALARLRELDLEQIELTAFERGLIEDTRRSL